MKNIVIIGGSGFIGSNLVLYLSNFCKITCLGRGENQHILKSLINENVSLISDDTLTSVDVPDLIKDSALLIHLAGGGGNNFFLQNHKAIGESLRLTNRIIELCKHFKKKLIFTSSISVYTAFTQRQNPLSELIQPLPEDFYGSLKLLIEYMIKDLKIEYIILRLPNIYGYSLKFESSGVIGRFIEAASKGLPIDIFTDGNNKMDYLYLDDLNRAFKSIIEMDIKNETINLGSGNLYSLSDIASEISGIFLNEYNKDVKINILNKDSMVYADRVLSNEKANAILGWSPSISLKEGLRQTIRRYMDDSLNTPA